jgi:3-phosphoshikimate 1-carboxyvinyltransferase
MAQIIPMDLEISPTGTLRGVVKAPPSKSYTHRAIIASALSKGTVKINDPLLSADPLSTVAAMRQAGATIDIRGHQIFVSGTDGVLKAPKLVDVGNSGTTLRILASVFSLCDKKVTLTGDESIQARPMGPLLEALEAAGVKTASKNGNPPISVCGPITHDQIDIRGDLSSQYISGLLIAAPLRKSNTTINITTPLKSRPYLDLTLKIMEDFGVEVKNDAYKNFFIEGGQFYSKNEYTIEGDYSGAAFILGASALTEDVVTVKNLFESSSQGDKYFIDILKMMGAKVNTTKDSVIVSGGRKLRAADIDLCDSPDLLPMTAVLCSLAKGTSTIHNVEHARIKECDRISAMAIGLRKMGVNLEERKDGLVIEGSNSLSGARIESFKDHRIVMAFAVAAMVANGKTYINHAESVNVSYPGFIEDMNLLGANMQQI